MMGSSSLFFILLTTIFAKHLVAQPSQPTYFNDVCEDAYGTYDDGSAYGSNLVSLLSDIETQSSTASSYSTSVGIGTDTVYGQYYCRGDIDAVLCNSCIVEAAQVVQSNCTNYISASVWFNVCTLYYSNTTSPGLWDPLPRIRGWVTSNVSDPSAFSVVLKDTMDTLISTAAADTITHFATGEGVVSSLQTVYCLVQCDPDLNVTYCSECLQSTYNVMPRCCGQWPLQLYVFYNKCQLRYSTVAAFYKVSGSPSPALNSTPPPPSTPGSSPSPPSTPGSSPSPPSTPGTTPPSSTLDSLITQTELKPVDGKLFGNGNDRLKLGLTTIAIGFVIFVLVA